MTDATWLLAKAVEADRASAARILYGAAAFDVLTREPMVLVGGGAQVTYTGVGRHTDIDLVGEVGPEDEAHLVEAGFRREGRHWIYEQGGAALGIEVPGAALAPEESYEEVDLGDAVVRIISATDLMMDRLVQASDGTSATRHEAEQLVRAVGDRVDWEAITARAEQAAAASGFLRGLVDLVKEFQEMAAPLA